jgi:uncharacterized membrane protein
MKGLFWLAYPFVLYGGLHWGSPRIVGVLLLVMLLLRHRGDARRLLTDMGRTDRLVLLYLIAHASLSALTNSELLVRLFPCAMNVGFLVLFARSLCGPQSMIERFARLKESDLSAEGVIYTRQVTKVWCVFLAANACVALWSALYASREVWAFYNGFLAYVLMGILFAGEWLYRMNRQRKWALSRHNEK